MIIEIGDIGFFHSNVLGDIYPIDVDALNSNLTVWQYTAKDL